MILQIYIMKKVLIIISLVFLVLKLGQAAQVLCQGNRFLFLSTFVLGRQQDLALTFEEVNRTAKIEEVVYREEIFRTYRIFNIKQNITYQQSKQVAELKGKNVLKVSGGNTKITLAFQWEKVQLGTSLFGEGTASVSSDTIAYEKTLYTNTSHELQWYLSKSNNLSIANGVALNTMSPYKAADYQILSNMLNHLKTNQSTVKDNLLKVLNANFQNILAQKVFIDQTQKFDKNIEYIYTDYRGKFEINYINTLMNSTLAEDGLYLLFSQVIQGDADFECGPTVPFQPNDPVFGGLQEFISNSLLKSTLKYAIKNGSLDVVLTEEYWQSRAFQFFMGDVHEVMPTSTKHIQTLQQIKGRCTAFNDPVFTFAYKTSSSYEVRVNLACDLNFNESKLISVNLVVNYEVKPKLSSKRLDFVLSSITGAPAFVETSPFKIQYQELAQFMVAETLDLAKSGNVLGSGYKAASRKYPQIMVKKDYLFLYDSSARSKGSKVQ